MTHLLRTAPCNIDLQGITALQVAQRMGHTAIATLIRNTKQKIAKNVVRQVEEELSSTTTAGGGRVLVDDDVSLPCSQPYLRRIGVGLGQLGGRLCYGGRQRASKSKWTRCVFLLLSTCGGGGGTDLMQDRSVSDGGGLRGVRTRASNRILSGEE